MVVDDRVTVTVECRCQHAFGERHADCVGKTLSERAGGGFHARRHAMLRVPRCFGMQLAKSFQFRHRQIVARQMQQCIQQHRAMAIGQHKAVAIGPRRIGGVMVQVFVPQGFRDIRHAHGHAGMTGIRLLHSVHRQHAYRVS